MYIFQQLIAMKREKYHRYMVREYYFNFSPPWYPACFSLFKLVTLVMDNVYFNFHSKFVWELGTQGAFEFEQCLELTLLVLQQCWKASFQCYGRIRDWEGTFFRSRTLIGHFVVSILLILVRSGSRCQFFVAIQSTISAQWKSLGHQQGICAQGKIFQFYR